MSASPAPTRSYQEQEVHLLLISPSEDDHTTLREILSHSKWSLREASNSAEAIAMIRKENTPVIICERSLPDGDWIALLQETKTLPDPPKVIVSSRVAGERLWADVLSLGAYDLVATPFDGREVLRIGYLAWNCWRNAWERRRAKPAGSASSTRERPAGNAVNRRF
jgi:DNA-binding NtrC family response regulator